MLGWGSKYTHGFFLSCSLCWFWACRGHVTDGDQSYLSLSSFSLRARDQCWPPSALQCVGLAGSPALWDSFAHAAEVCSVVTVVSPKSPGVRRAKRAELSVGRPVPKFIKHHMEGMDVKEFHSSLCQTRHGGTLLSSQNPEGRDEKVSYSVSTGPAWKTRDPV